MKKDEPAGRAGSELDHSSARCGCGPAECRPVPMSDRLSTTTPDRLLTADEVAAMLHVTKSWVYDQTRRDRMPHVRLGRYRRAAVDRWIEDLEARGEAATRRTR